MKSDKRERPYKQCGHLQEIKEEGCKALWERQSGEESEGVRKERELNARREGHLREMHRQTCEGEKCCNHWRENGTGAGRSF